MKRLEKFSVEAFLSSLNNNKGSTHAGYSRFEEVCQQIKRALDEEFERMSTDEAKTVRLEKEKGAIIGKESDVMYFKDRISQILANKKLLSESYPTYYPNLTEAVFAELYGLSGISPWAYDWTAEYKESSSAKLIGDKLYCLINGQSQLQPQRISKERRAQLRKALLLAHPEERTESGINEVFLENGIRVTMFSEDLCKGTSDTIVFRKYILKKLSFELLASYGTFPKEAIPLFESMVDIGYNTLMVGEMRSGKTTFLQTFCHYYSDSLEGCAIATDPETDWSQILPNAPIMQIVVKDAKDLDAITKPIRRSDADYILLEEMRDAAAYRLFNDIISIGTMHSAGTIHDRSSINVPKKMADAIATTYGGDRDSIIAQLYGSINYVIELYQVPENKARKRLKGIVEFRYDEVADKVSATRICQYDAVTDSWKWKCEIGQDKKALAMGYESAFERFESTLKALEKANPLTGDTTVYPAYYIGNRKGRDE